MFSFSFWLPKAVIGFWSVASLIQSQRHLRDFHTYDIITETAFVLNLFHFLCNRKTYVISI